MQPKGRTPWAIKIGLNVDKIQLELGYNRFYGVVMVGKSKPLKIEAIFFDLYNTLARFWPPRHEIQSRACREHGLWVTYEGINLGYRNADQFMSEENARHPIGTRTRVAQERFFTKYEKLILEGAGVVANESLANRIWQGVNRIPYGMKLYEDVEGAMQIFKHRGISVGVITNMDRDGEVIGAELGLNTMVDFVLTSKDVESTKPDPQIFLKALDRTGALRESAIHVGDQTKSDVKGAIAAGIFPILIERNGFLSQVDEDRPKWVPAVSNLDELVRLLFN